MKRHHLLFLTSLIMLTLVSQDIWTQSPPALKPGGKVLAPKAPLVTFIELGSVNCIPCRMMQPVMRAIEKKYGDQIKVVFYDVWTPEQRQYAALYRIRVIPTQVFLNKEEKEIYRHEGFFPEAEIDKLLQKQGLKIQTGG